MGLSQYCAIGSPRCSNSCTTVAWKRPFILLQPWPFFWRHKRRVLDQHLKGAQHQSAQARGDRSCTSCLPEWTYRAITTPPTFRAGYPPMLVSSLEISLPQGIPSLGSATHSAVCMMLMEPTDFLIPGFVTQVSIGTCTTSPYR